MAEKLLKSPHQRQNRCRSAFPSPVMQTAIFFDISYFSLYKNSSAPLVILHTKGALRISGYRLLHHRLTAGSFCSVTRAI